MSDLPIALPSYFEALSKLGVERQFRPHATILTEGDLGDALYLLVKGEVISYSQSANGKIISYNSIKAGNYFGEMALDGGARSANVKAHTSCVCIIIPNEQVLAFMRDDPEFAKSLLMTVIKRARTATAAAKNMALSDVYERLRKILYQEFEANDKLCALTHSQMAAQIGASREMVSKLLKSLESGGYVQALQRKQIRLLTKLPDKW